MAEYKSRKRRRIPELVIALCVLICIPSTKGVTIDFGDSSVDSWKFAIGANSKEILHDFCKFNATTRGTQCKNFPIQASVDFEKVCNCTIIQHNNGTNEGSLLFDLNCKSNLSYCPEELTLTYRQGSYVRAPDLDVTTSGINGWLVVSIISIAVNVLAITIILYLCKEKVHAFFKPMWTQLCTYSQSIYSRIIERCQRSERQERLLNELALNEKLFEILCKNCEQIDQIVSAGKSIGKPIGRADLGYFEDNKGKKIALEPCLLVVRYDFNGQRDGDKEDVKALKKTFYENRNCHFRSLLSPRKDHLLQLLSDQKKLLSLFDRTNDVPSDLVLVFLSHGKEGGKIFTDHWNEESDDYVHFTTKEVYDALAKLNKFKTSLKLINFCVSFKYCEKSKSQPCQGGSDEETPRSESCQKSPSHLHNTAVLFSTDDTTRTPLDGKRSSTFVQRLCETLDTIESDTTLLNFLTTVLCQVHKELQKKIPTVEIFSLKKNLFISKGKKKQPEFQTISESDGKGSNLTERSQPMEMFSWKLDAERKPQKRLAFLFYQERTEIVDQFQQAICQNFGFETSVRNLETLPSYFQEVTELEHDVGFIFTVLFGKLTLKSDANEVSVVVGNEDLPIMDILHRIVGPKNQQWIGRPKILFVIDQISTATDDVIRANTTFRSIDVANLGGSLVLILKNAALANELLEIFKDPG